MRLALLASMVLVCSEAFGYPQTPDVKMTPGSICTKESPDYEEDRYDQKIPYCYRNVSYETKQAIYDAYGIPQEERKEYTIDHLIPLSVGGSNQVTNLWPEHKNVKATRPDFETQLYIDVSEGRMTQQEAIDAVMEEKF